VSVYFITCREIGYVKIGCAYDPFSRLKTLQTAFPLELKVEALLKGSYKREKELHGLLATHRVRGEWFKICPEIEAIISEVEKPTRRKSLAQRGQELAEDTPTIRRMMPKVPAGIGFPDSLPPPRITPAFNESALTRAERKRIASGDIYFPFRAKEDV
jgi:hypothetical protein